MGSVIQPFNSLGSVEHPSDEEQPSQASQFRPRTHHRLWKGESGKGLLNPNQAN